MSNASQSEIVQLRQQLDLLIEQARNNEDIMRRHQEFDLTFIGASGFVELIDRIFEALSAPSKLDVVTLALIDNGYDIRRILQDLKVGLDDFPNLLFFDDPVELGPLRKLMRPVLGAFNAPREGVIFPEQVLTPTSAALVPLWRNKAMIGMLGLGSCDATRFTSGMATDFLEHMAAIVSVCLENVINVERLKHMGLMDAVTGVNNRRYAEMRLIEEVGRCRRHGAPLSCLYVDIDHFKEVNDKHGHQCGDEVLREVAARIKAELRLSDTLGRFGGEEFIVLLPDTPIPFAAQVAERIRSSIADRPFIYAGAERQVTVSLGVAGLNTASVDLQQAAAGQRMVAEADHALYRAKGNGRNRVEIQAG